MIDRNPTPETVELWHRAVPISWAVYGDDEHVGAVIDMMQTNPSFRVRDLCPTPPGPPGWRDLEAGGYTVRPVGSAEVWTESLGDYTAETIVAMTAWEGNAMTPAQAPTILAKCLCAGDWVLGLYRVSVMVGLFDVGRILADGRHMTDWFAVRPEFRGTIPAETFAGLAGEFIAWLRGLGVRQMVAFHSLATPEGRKHSATVEKHGWRRESVEKFRETKVKDI